MFRNAQYRKSLLDSLESAEDRGQAAQLALPSVSGKIIVEIGPEMKAEVGATARNPSPRPAAPAPCSAQPPSPWPSTPACLGARVLHTSALAPAERSAPVSGHPRQVDAAAYMAELRSEVLSVLVASAVGPA